MKRIIFRAVAAAAAIVAVSGVATVAQEVPLPSVTVTEALTIFDPPPPDCVPSCEIPNGEIPNGGGIISPPLLRIDYTITHDGPANALQIVGFAVDFGIPEIAGLGVFAGAERIAWDAVVLTEEEWNFSDPFSSFGSFGIRPGAGSLFSNFFDEGQVAFFYANDIFAPGEGGELVTAAIPIGPDDGTVGGFFVQGDVVIESRFLAFCAVQGQLTPCASGDVTGVTGVPEPGTLALFGIGVIGIGVAIRRRRRIAA